jgi:O-acetyl-ADP-ribose deacetylase (regulator of RNase III)
MHPLNFLALTGFRMACYNPDMSSILRQKVFPLRREFQIVQGDLTQEQVDAVVNAANSHLQHGGGVAGVIVRQGGLVIQQESNEWVRKYGSVSHAEPAYTTAGRLPCKYVIHAVGPIWGEGEEDAKLSEAVMGSLRLADELELSSLALPAISTGIFGFPKARAANIIYETIEQYFIRQPESGLMLVRLTLFDQQTVDVFLNIFDEGNG